MHSTASQTLVSNEIRHHITSKFYKEIRNFFDQEYHQLSLWYFVLFIFGIVYFFSRNPDWNLIPLISVISAGFLISILVRQRSTIFPFFLFLILAFLLGVASGSYRMTSTKTEVLTQITLAEITGIILQINPTTSGSQIILSDVEITDTRTKRMNVRVNIKNHLEKNYNAGDKVRLKAKLFPLQASILPDTYDFGFYLYLQSIGATGYALSKIDLLSRDENHTFAGFVNKIRLRIYVRIIEVLGEKAGNFVAAILIGETTGLDRKTYDIVRNSGIAHILSVSGLHLTLVAMIFFFSFRVTLNLSNFIAHKYDIKMISGLFAIFGSLVYLFLSGTKVAATRAFIMTSLYIAAVIIGRSPYPIRSVFLAAFLILLFSPENVMHPSFQLSFAAVLCLISGYELYMRHQHIFGQQSGIISSIKMYIFANIYTSFLASFVTAPFVIYHFYKFANYSVLMNLVAVPLMSFFMMPLGLLAMITFNSGLDYYLLKIVGIFVDIILIAAEKIVNLPGAIWYFGYISPASLAIFTLGFFGICLWQTTFRLYWLIIIFISCYLMAISPKPDFIFDTQYKAIGIKNQQEELEILSDNKLPDFTASYWANWYGQETAKFTKMPIYGKDLLFHTATGKTISLNYNYCKRADVMLITSKRLNCSDDGLLIDYKQLKNLKSLLVFCNENECKLKLNKILGYGK